MSAFPPTDRYPHISRRNQAPPGATNGYKSGIKIKEHHMLCGQNSWRPAVAWARVQPPLYEYARWRHSLRLDGELRLCFRR